MSDKSPYSAVQVNDDPSDTPYDRMHVDDSAQAPLLPQPVQASPTFKVAGASAGSGYLIEQVAQHPALPVACYCVASILMTVVNKVGCCCRHK
jgi:hypothetical protein